MSTLTTIASSLTGAIAAAEMDAGAALLTNTPWLLPALFTLMVFVGVVIAVQLISGTGASALAARVRGRDAAPTPPPAPYDLRAPDRAVAEVTRGLFRSHDS